MFAFALIAASLPPAPPPREKASTAAEAVRKALPLLVQAAEGHVDQRTCFACHNQALPMLAFAAGKARGLSLPADTIKNQTEHIASFIATNREKFRKGEGTGGAVDTAGYAILTLELGGYKADANTEAVVEYLLKTQPGRDHWRTTSHRPPSEASEFTPTYLALRGLRHWGTAEQKERGAKRVEAARSWLVRTKAKDTEDRVFRLFGLKEAGASEKEIAAAAWELLKTQQPGGGWRQLDGMEPDAYATATALVSLHEAGGLSTEHPAYGRGAAFLVKAQRTDGSWYIKSRSKPFQPYYESGFPHGKDQFISSAASGWAATALILSGKR
ncbi:MAG TPA: prenyltransferase/squalene oxidase repeat-containing protein [Urbifossiella sp.]|nr:prenyltransferase/squalene oxidase repeat-containing protein [Urbifossiella sp.]